MGNIILIALAASTPLLVLVVLNWFRERKNIRKWWYSFIYYLLAVISYAPWIFFIVSIGLYRPVALIEQPMLVIAIPIIISTSLFILHEIYRAQWNVWVKCSVQLAFVMFYGLSLFFFLIG